VQKETETGEITVKHQDTIVGKPPELKEEDKSYSFLPIFISIILGTAFLFVLIKFKLKAIWKGWFLFAIITSLAVAFNVYVNEIAALILAIILGIWRWKKPNLIVHNFTEVFIYTGITILILPWLNLFSAFMLLILISFYDMYAVWKSEHMVKLAKFQMQNKMFAGLSINYFKDKEDPKIELNKSPGIKDEEVKEIKHKKANAILGGGDITFPLIFTAAIMEYLIKAGMPKLNALMHVYIITLFAGIALSLLFFFSKKGRFYPAMPFLSMGCFIGSLIAIFI